MELSILDLATLAVGKTAKDVLEDSTRLAKAGEEFGYTRFWIAEHHNISALCCPSPEVMLGYIGANTETIRLGSGATLHPYYKPYKIAETFNLLSSLFPNRIDLGVGRGPGGSPEAKLALSDNFSEQAKKFPDTVKELKDFLDNSFPHKHPYSTINAYPIPSVPPQLWILGTSLESARLAALYGVPYAFGHFLSANKSSEIMNYYHNNLKGKESGIKPKTIFAVFVICAETNERAQELARSALLWEVQLSTGIGDKGLPSFIESNGYTFSRQEMELIRNFKNKMIIGSPTEVKKKLIDIQNTYKVDEIMILTNTFCFEDRIKSYKLIAKEVFSV
ncbi:LLM class flavin-dependent oxidoreductase [Cytobacillus firmus]|uniref:LLM class flavin-dependent oxidoreductase n=1 Tax=Cytobacillus firmus TaxID=1399 RepID=UPI002041A434|nr:LLM class flavin-dependent oxidoreductase [Cytobacillus firmus]MCM3708676.1 LLM class flavin-dependent oxidoreductase [Cytobacillus firmus]